MEVLNYIIDEGIHAIRERAPRDRLSRAGLKPLQAAVVKSHGGERCRKRQE